MVTEQDVGKWCRYVVNGEVGAQGTLTGIEKGWATLREEDNEGVFIGTWDFPAGLCEVGPPDLGTLVVSEPAYNATISMTEDAS